MGRRQKEKIINDKEEERIRRRNMYNNAKEI